ncbi:cobalamin 5'-phosphate synthase [Methanocaldococcus villosus KIN24-T80]|uniref:Adenosylcobinamide-GDP ribazoletransferase n=1 Tax=Methanocaldococcus villosus KIN24-T80 TaxID=1069083 RepID=N6VZF5_9EURY|nr:adenosylcobinamide-GDP ribazoletransferase [Methanocaldococcus villosus]ENN96492.1 cobalamin 5'-phosphate synthase [Methanocaldococcus villosus KIN24-T80]
MIRAFKLMLSFFTRFPINVEDFNFDTIAEHFYLVVIIGYIYGAISYFLSFLPLPPLLLSCIILFTIEFINGFHHFDGLLDFGEGLMVIADRKTKLKIMKDPYVGTFGLSFGVFYIITTVVSIYYILKINPLYLLAVEVLSKLSLLSCASFGNPLKEGTGKYFVKRADEKFLALALILSLPLLLIFDSTGRKAVSLAIIISVLLGLFMAKLAKGQFGGVNGDVLGATNEVSRVINLIAILFFLLTLEHNLSSL